MSTGTQPLGTSTQRPSGVPGRIERADLHFVRPVGAMREGKPMPLYLIERNFAEQLEVEVTKETIDTVNAVKAINIEEENRWLFSFLSADKKKTYCLYEAPSIEAIRKAAERAGLPADVITEVTEVRPEMFV
jgi:Protein of unknown function (DUF4242)